MQLYQDTLQSGHIISNKYPLFAFSLCLHWFSTRYYFEDQTWNINYMDQKPKTQQKPLTNSLTAAYLCFFNDPDANFSPFLLTSVAIHFKPTFNWNMAQTKKLLILQPSTLSMIFYPPLVEVYAPPKVKSWKCFQEWVCLSMSQTAFLIFFV